MIIEKDCDDWKGLWWLKKIVISEKDCDNWKGFCTQKKQKDATKHKNGNNPISDFFHLICFYAPFFVFVGL